MKVIRFAVLVVLLLSAISTFATCQVSSTQLNQPNVLSGSAIVANSWNVTGSGAGAWVTSPANGMQFNLSYQTFNGAGGQYPGGVLAQINSITSGGAHPEAGIMAWFGVQFNFAAVYETVNAQNQFVITFAESTAHGTYRTVTIIGTSGGLASVPWLELVPVFNADGSWSLSGYYSTDGTNYLYLGTISSIFQSPSISLGLFSDSGDTTHLTSSNFVGVSGLTLSALVDADVDYGGQPAGSAAPGMQGGNLYIGPNPVSGGVYVGGCGTGNSLNVNNEINLTDITTGQQITNLDQNFLPQVSPCDTGCSFSYLMEQPGGGSFGPFTLTHLHQYKITNSTQADIPNKAGTPTISQTVYLNP